MRKYEKFSSTKKIFRQIKSLVISLVKRYFHEIFAKLYAAQCTAQCGNYGNLLSLFFGKNFVKIMILLTKLLNS